MINGLHRVLPALVGLLMLAGCAHKPALYSESNQLKIKPLWVKHVGKGNADHHLNLQPFAYKKQLYTTSYLGSVSSYLASNGGFLKKVFTKHKMTAPAVVRGDMMFAVSVDGAVSALNLSTNHVQWRHYLSGEVLVAPIIKDDMLLVKTENDQLFAFNTETGKSMWHYKTDAPSLILRGSGKPVVIGNAVIAGFANGELTKLDLRTGALLWKSEVSTPKGITSIERMVDMDATPVVLNDRIYWANYQGAVGAYDLESGAGVWQHPASVYSGIATDGEALFLSDAQQHVKAYTLDKGTLLWEQKGFDKHAVLTEPVVYGKYLMLADQWGYLHWLNKRDGKSVSSIKLVDNSGFTAPPLLIGDRQIVMLTDSGDMLSLIAKKR